MFERCFFHFAALVLVCQLTSALPAMAGGLYAGEFASVDMGAAGSGTLARGEDAATAVLNPAAMTRLDSHQLNFGLAPGFSSVKFDQDSDSPSSRDNGGGQGGFIPLLGSAYVHKLSDRIRLGLGAFSISGAALDPDDDWAGRSQMTEIQLFTLTVAPTVAVKITDWLSVGAGPAITYGTLDWTLKIGSDGRIKFDDMDDWAVAAIVGVLIEPNDTFRVGLAYQSETDLKLKGDVDVDSAGPAGSVNGKIDLPLAHALRADARWQAFDKVAFSMGAAVEFWQSLEDTDIELGGTTSNVHLGFKNTWKLRGGVHYQVNEQWMAQTGLSYDSSALNTSDRIAALPMDEQWRWGIGGTYAWSESTTVGFGFEYVNLGRGNIDKPGIKGDYQDNDIFFFMVNLNLAKLPWDERGTF